MTAPRPTNIPGVSKQLVFPQTGADANVLRDELFKEGMIRMVQKDIPGAIKAFTKFSKKKPNSFEVWSALGNIYLQIKNIPEAKNCYKKSLKINPTNPRDWEALGSILFEETQPNIENLDDDELFGHRIPETIKCFENALKYNPENHDLKFKLGMLYSGIYQFDKALNHLENFLKVKPNNPHVLKAVQMVKQQAKKVETQRRTQSNTFIPTKQPTSDIKCPKCGVIREGTDKFCKRCGEAFKKPSEGASLNLGEISEQRKRDEARYPGDPNGKEIQSERVRVIYDKAIDNFKQHNFNEAKRLLEEAVNLEPDIPDIYVQLGINHYMLQNEQKGLEFLKKAIKLNPYQITAHELLEKIYSLSGKTSNAEDVFQKLKSFGVMYTNYMCDMGFNILNSHDPSKKLKDNYESAKPVFERVLLFDPNNKEANFYLNEIESLSFVTKEIEKFNGDYDKAVEYYRNQLKLNPNDRRTISLLREAELKQLGLDL